MRIRDIAALVGVVAGATALVVGLIYLIKLVNALTGWGIFEA